MLSGDVPPCHSCSASQISLTPNTYTHVLPELQRDAARRIDATRSTLVRRAVDRLLGSSHEIQDRAGDVRACETP